MPTVLLLDVSLSLCQPVLESSGQKIVEDNGEPVLRKNLAIAGCYKILDHFSQHCKLEFTSLIIFSSLFEVLVRFTRDFDLVKQSLSSLEDYDKTNLKVGLLGVSQLILEEWGNGTPCQVVLITDGSVGTELNNLRRSLSSVSQTSHESNLGFPLPFPFPAKLNIVCIANAEDPSFKVSQPIYRQLLDLNGEGSLYTPEGVLSPKTSLAMFDKLIQENFMPYNGTLKCGSLSSAIMLSPPPQPYYRHHDFEVVRESVTNNIQIFGFLNIADVSSPPSFSRHLVMAVVTEADLTTYARDCQSDEENEVIDEGKIPSFCVLLHGGLKREKTVALCQVGSNWYGMIYAWADNKKKSNLMLSIFKPGIDVIPWIGKITNLGPADMLSSNPYGSTFSSTPFPLKVSEKKSYAQNCVVWVRYGGLQSDVQKILRHARKLPEKHSSFYKELNRLRKAASMYGFPDLLLGLASLLERECYNLPSTAHPEAAIQLQHASESLRQCVKKDTKQNIISYKND